MNKTRASILCTLAALTSYCGKDPAAPSNGPAPSKPGERAFVSVADWTSENSVLTGVNAVAPGRLQIAGNVDIYATPQIWVANSAANTVSQIDTKTFALLGTYPLQPPAGEDCFNPSRTSVDLDGSVWVGCRGKDSYISRNALNPAAVPVIVDHKVVKLDTKGNILLSLNVGHAPRGLALDASNHMWIANSVDDTIWEVDATTGACLRGEAPTLPGGPACPKPAIKLPYGSFPYGAIIDQRGHLWTSNFYSMTVSEIDTETGTVIGNYGPYDRNGCKEVYGMGIDPGNNVWIGGHGCNDVLKIKGGDGIDLTDNLMHRSGDLLAAFPVGGAVSRGVAVDLNGDVWVASSGTNTATKIQNSTGKVLASVTVGKSPIGVGVDAYGNAWVVNQGSNSVHRINGLNTADMTEVAVGEGPYTYSDMLGMVLRKITYRGDGFANWQTIVDSGAANPKWGTAKWQATTPPGTEVKLRARCAASKAALATAGWGPFIDASGPFECGAGSGGQFAQVELRLYTHGAASSPVVNHLTVQWGGSP